MFRLRQYLQVLQAVVVLYSVSVMNVLCWQQFTTKMLLHNPAMFGLILRYSRAADYNITKTV